MACKVRAQGAQGIVIGECIVDVEANPRPLNPKPATRNRVTHGNHE